MEYEPFVIDWDQHGPYVIATRGDLPDIIGSDEVALLATCGLLAPRGGTDEQIQRVEWALHALIDAGTLPSLEQQTNTMLLRGWRTFLEGGGMHARQIGIRYVLDRAAVRDVIPTLRNAGLQLGEALLAWLRIGTAAETAQQTSDGAKHESVAESIFKRSTRNQGRVAVERRRAILDALALLNTGIRDWGDIHSISLAEWLVENIEVCKADKPESINRSDLQEHKLAPLGCRSGKRGKDKVATAEARDTQHKLLTGAYKRGLADQIVEHRPATVSAPKVVPFR